MTSPYIAGRPGTISTRSGQNLRQALVQFFCILLFIYSFHWLSLLTNPAIFKMVRLLKSETASWLAGTRMEYVPASTQTYFEPVSGNQLMWYYVITSLSWLTGGLGGTILALTVSIRRKWNWKITLLTAMPLLLFFAWPYLVPAKITGWHTIIYPNLIYFGYGGTLLAGLTGLGLSGFLLYSGLVNRFIIGKIRE